MEGGGKDRLLSREEGGKDRFLWREEGAKDFSKGTGRDSAVLEAGGRGGSACREERGVGQCSEGWGMWVRGQG